MVYVLHKDGNPLMPTERHGRVRWMLKDGRAVVVRSNPFTIRLTYKTTPYTQAVTLGVDAGYSMAGFRLFPKTRNSLPESASCLRARFGHATPPGRPPGAGAP